MNRPAGLAVVGVVAGATLAGLGLRLASAPHLVRGGLHLWYDPDSSYHMLRVERTLANFPHVPSFDPDADAPEGFRCPWPPGFDLALAAAARALGGTPAAIAALGTWAPALLGAAAAPATAWLAFELGGARAAGWAAIAVATLPGHIYKTLAGRPDHHAAEALVSALVLALVLFALRTGSRAAWISAGLGNALAIAMWPGAVILPGVIAAGLTLTVMVGRAAQESLPYNSPAGGWGIAGGTALLLTIPLCALSPLGRAGGWSFEELSWFQPAGLVAAILAPWLGAWAGRAPRAAAAGGAGLLALILMSPIGVNLLGGLRYVAPADPWLAATQEVHRLTPARAFGFLGYGAAVLPLLLAAWAWRGRAEGRVLTAAPWIAAALALSVLQARFINIGAVAAAVLYGIGLAAWPAKWLGASAALWLVAWLPCGAALGQIGQAHQALSPGPALAEALTDLRARPKGIVMASPWEGHWIEALAGQRVIGNNFHTNRAGNLATARFFAAGSKAEAAAALRERPVRYVLLTETAEPLSRLGAEMLHRPVPDRPFAARVVSGEETPPGNWRLRFASGLPAGAGRPAGPAGTGRLAGHGAAFLFELEP